jgi:predicted membrane chloride channel (bestrophin family)
MFMTSWATFLSVLFMRLEKVNPVAAQAMSLPQSPHSLMVSALSLLLVFKTNSAYQRFAEGRKIWESIINISRDLYRLMNLYEVEMGRSKRRRLQRLLAAFPYLLRHRIRPNLVMYRLDDEENVRDPENSIVLYQDRAADDLDPEAAAVATQEENAGNSRRRTRPLYWVDKRTLPWRLLPKNALEACARAQNRPLWVCDRMGQELRTIPDGPHFTARERLALISKVEKLSGCIGACERIHQTAVPLNYARHSLRALTLWLFTLPFALVGSLKLLTGPVLFLVSWLLFGVYEIGYSIEDPFQGTLRLSVLCDTIRRDVLADEVIRSTAFLVDEDDSDSVTSTAAPLARSEDEVDGEGDNHRDYEASSVFKPPTVNPVEEVVEEGLYDEEDRDYESSPVSREIPMIKDDEEPLPSRKAEPVEVEELPNIPIFRDLNSSEFFRNKKP